MGTTYQQDTVVTIVCDDGYKYEICRDADDCVSVKYFDVRNITIANPRSELILTDTYCLGMAKDALLIAKGITEVANSMLKQE